MGFSINDLALTFPVVFGGHKLRLESVTEWTDYNTKNQLGTKYRLRDEELCLKFDLKVRNMTPIISNEDLRKSDKKIYVSVVAHEMSFHGKNVYDADVSVVAESISIKPAVNTAAKSGVF